MPGYAVGILYDVDLNAEVADYLRRIDGTLEPYEGRFLIHGARPEVLEGEFTAAFIVIEFPDLDAAKAWYDSPAYQEIIPLRARNSRSNAFVIRGVPDGYKAASLVG